MNDVSEPAWDVALLFPAQGEWTSDDYLALDTNHYVELSGGRIEVLSMPTDPHQAMVMFLCTALLSCLQRSRKTKGRVRPGPLPVLLWAGEIRQPDVLFMLQSNEKRCHVKHWDGADLVMEVVSPGKRNRHRDLVTKRREYARAGIPEYWIIDPEEGVIVVLTLLEGTYEVHGEYRRGAVAKSTPLPSFSVSVDAVLGAM